MSENLDKQASKLETLRVLHISLLGKSVVTAELNDIVTGAMAKTNSCQGA